MIKTTIKIPVSNGHLMGLQLAILLGVCSFSPCFARKGDSRTVWKSYTVPPTTVNPCTNSTDTTEDYDREGDGTSADIVNLDTGRSQFSGSESTSASDWEFYPSITKGGLTLKNVRQYTNWFNDEERVSLKIENGKPRLMATEMDIPKYWTSNGPTDPPKQKQLDPKYFLGLKHTQGSGIYTYKADFKDPDTCTVITQKYMFYAPSADHEPHKLVWQGPVPTINPHIRRTYVASRWIPLVAYTHFSPHGNANFRLTTQQRLGLNASYDALPKPQHPELLRDYNLSDLTHTLDFTPGPFIQALEGNDLKGSWDVIKNGVSKEYSNVKFKFWYEPHSDPALGPSFGGRYMTGTRMNPDNLHQTYEKSVAWPQGGWVKDKDGRWYLSFAPQPGCPECIHIHWRWTDMVDAPGATGDPTNIFGHGKALIPPGSKQSVTITLKGDDFYYTAAGKGSHDEFFAHGGFYSSRGTYGQ